MAFRASQYDTPEDPRTQDDGRHGTDGGGATDGCDWGSPSVVVVVVVVVVVASGGHTVARGRTTERVPHALDGRRDSRGRGRGRGRGR